VVGIVGPQRGIYLRCPRPDARNTRGDRAHPDPRGHDRGARLRLLLTRRSRSDTVRSPGSPRSEKSPTSSQGADPERVLARGDASRAPARPAVAALEIGSAAAAGGGAADKTQVRCADDPPTTLQDVPRMKPTTPPIDQYSHADKSRLNNPPVGLVTPSTDLDGAKKTYSFDPHVDPALNFDANKVATTLDGLLTAGAAAKTLEAATTAIQEIAKLRSPFLNWAGKAERNAFEVPTVSIHVHERIDPRTVMAALERPRPENSGTQLGLFDSNEENPPLREALNFYMHSHRWSNRLIAGDSLLVMNSLIEREGLAESVQAVYMDPPYGIDYGSNFQPFINKLDVRDRRAEDLTAEPETLKAFRDMWQLDIHSYLSYLRDRLWLAKELLKPSGSVFLQISDRNLHFVRNLLDEVFGVDNFVSLISFTTTSGFQTRELARAGDYILWYAKNKKDLKVRKLWVPARRVASSTYKYLTLPDGTRQTLTAKHLRGEIAVPEGRLYMAGDLQSQGASSSPQVWEYDGKPYRPLETSHWKANYPDGMNRLAYAGRIHVARKTVRYVRYADDFGYRALTNMWEDTGTGNFTDDKIFVVQTNTKVVKRCLLMSTDPGDLVLDPTCGSGTTAYVAEEWGRRWITIDSSRIAITLAKQRLMTSIYPYYSLAQPFEGISSGLRYRTAKHVTLESIANNPEIVPGMSQAAIDEVTRRYAADEEMFDDPVVDEKTLRVAGPFTVEAVPAPIVLPLGDGDLPDSPQDDSIAREGETSRQDNWRTELLRTGVQGKNGQRIRFATVETFAGARYLHADAVVDNSDTGPLSGQRVVVSFGPEFSLLEQRQVELAWEEAQRLSPRPKVLLFLALEFDPEAAKDIDSMEADKAGMAFLKAQISMDLTTDDLRKKRASDESFWLIGQPDVELMEQADGKTIVQVNGFDYFNLKTGLIDSGGPDKIAMWMLDPDYDGRSLYPRQVFLPMANDEKGWKKVAKTLGTVVDPERVATLASTTSIPFASGPNRRVAVKLIDDRGIECLVVRDIK
jgi:adenine-specific DNA-methyltransferase